MASYQNYPTELFDDLKQMLHASTERFGTKTLFMEKRKGTYESISFRTYCGHVNSLGTELLARGFGGKRIIVIGENCYNWVTAYMAVICGVGVVVPVDKEIPAEEICNIARISRAAAVIYSPKVAEKIAALDASVERISFDDLKTLIARGRSRMKNGDRRYLDAEIDNGALASLIFTSGTTGVSKGVMLSHHNICFNLNQMCKMVYIGEKDVFLSILPLHHCYECTCGFLCQIYRGCTVAFSEGLRYITKNMQEVKPTMMLCVPLLLETMYQKVWANIRRQGMEKKVLSAIKMTNAIYPEKLRIATKKKVFSTIHQSFGGRLRMLVSGGAPVDPAVLSGLRDLGISTRQGYGLTECAPIAALNRDWLYNDASAGLATPDTLLDIYDLQDDGTGEIRFKGDNVMLGYYEMPEETARVIKNGWFYTGDLGYLDEKGFLFITGRKKNVIVTANGKNIFPEELETYLGRTNFVKESVVVGYMNEKKHDYDIVALIYPDYERLREKYPTLTAEQLDLELQRAIAGVNAMVQSYKRIESYVLCEEEFPKNTSRKIKRAGLAEREYQKYLNKKR
ncbi:MAG: long-chain fatty acid--CoA ligase [Ruminococcaceae bacterium]|nr:long-chain fatty acid--CoA ligase [Oscillospiraceae bacterium]